MVNLNNNPEFWKRKLAAYLHDPPSKCLDIGTHGERSDAAFRQAGFIDTEVGKYYRDADKTAAAADRLPFPSSRQAELQCTFDGIRNAFRHPLNGTLLPFHEEFASVDAAFEGENSVQPKLTDECLERLPDDAARWRARFFAHWRLWPRHAMEKDYRLALLPADTRIPDHSIWTHMQVVSALAGCAGPDEVCQPGFLKFQLGPVQDFIAAARSTRDLWSGSYLLSWLMAAGLKKLSELVGPDAVIFPNLREQPLFDLHWREDLWSKVSISGQRSVWDSLQWEPRDLLTPNLPNVFLAVVPAPQATELAQAVCKAIEDEWKRISDAVWKACEQAGLTADEGGFTAAQRKARFDTQVERFLSLSWQVTPWPSSLEDALKLADGFASEMPIQQARARVQAIVDMAEKQMPVEHRDPRFYTDNKTKLNNLGLGWSVILAFNSWQLDAVRQTRAFPAANTGGWQVGTFNNKDALTGREEAVAGGRTWMDRAEKAGAPWATLFKHEDWLGAPTLIKRVWHYAYLAAEPWNLKTDPENFPMPNTRGIAIHDPEREIEEEKKSTETKTEIERYFAVLTLDGDEIGKWVSGEKTPKLETQLADYKDHSKGQRCGIRQYFEQLKFGNFLQTQRPLSPSYHLQFSEALSNFAFLCARPIVEAFDGRLIYAGGDDVLALLPADTALVCAQALRMAFQGSPAIQDTLHRHAAELRDRHLRKQARDSKASPPPYYQKLAAERCLVHGEHKGFLQRLDRVDQQHRPIPFLVPGPTADCSVGIAIAHYTHPLQDVIQEARAAQKRAKKQLGRSALAVTLIKRSGETVQWGCNWDSGGLEAYLLMSQALQNKIISARFPYRLIELTSKYINHTASHAGNTLQTDYFTKEEAIKVLEKEICFVAERQRGPNYDPAEVQRLCEAILQFLNHGTLKTARQTIAALIGLCQTVAFIARNTETSDSESPETHQEAERQVTYESQ